MSLRAWPRNILLLALILCATNFTTTFAQSAEATISATVLRGSNLRSGPGTNFAITGGARQGDQLVIVGTNAAGDWYELADGKWIAAFLVSPNQPVEAGAPPADSVAAQVTKIVDGDTIDVVINGETYRVRYILINTPEVDQPLYKEATEANRKLVEGKTVYLVKDVNETDRYGRLLRYIYLADGTFVNVELVRQGFAQLATFPPDVAKESEIRAAQQVAVAAGVGLWATEQGASPANQQPSGNAQPPAPTATPAPQPPAEAPAAPSIALRIVALDKRAEYADIVNQGTTAVNLAGWNLLSVRGSQNCPLGGVIEPGARLRIWAMAEDAGQGGFNCGFGSNIWNNSEYDPAVLIAPDGTEVSQYH